MAQFEIFADSPIPEAIGPIVEDSSRLMRSLDLSCTERVGEEPPCLTETSRQPPFLARLVPYAELCGRVHHCWMRLRSGQSLEPADYQPLAETFVAEAICRDFAAGYEELLVGIRAFAQAMLDGAQAGKTTTIDHQLERALLIVRVEAMLAGLERLGVQLRIKGWLTTPIGERHRTLADDVGTLLRGLKLNTLAAYRTLVESSERSA